jgi:two-component system, sensor histidine kinase and response regulator
MNDDIERRAASLFEEHQRSICSRTDRLFAVLMLCQWVAAIAAAWWITPRTWAGQYSQVHLHLWGAIFLGGAITAFPAALAWLRAGNLSTRCVIATAQMLMSGLLIHLTGGRLETHFHVFGSLAILAFYRDWRVFIPATIVVATDHFVRGVYWPQSVFGVLTASHWRWVEHAAWVIFENVFLVRSCLQSVDEMKSIAWQRAELEATNEIVERKVRERTSALVESQVHLRSAKDAAEAASQAKSIFLATMSHEIRTPMNGILGMTELVLDTELTEDQRDNLALVRVSAESLLAIINDILDFSKIEAGKLELESLRFDLRESVGEAMKALGFRAQQKGLELIYEIQHDVPEALVGDAGRIRQILVNLVGNAIKFTERGEIFVNVAVDSQSGSEACLHFSVRDTGVGIPLDKQHKIFEAFSQADGSMTRKYGGTGLGLTICSRLAETMHGRIWVESEPDRGSVFHFTARFEAQNEQPRLASTPVFQDNLGNLPVLVVDDNYTNRRVLCGMLTRWGMNPHAVDGGRAAVLALETASQAGQPFPLILLDGHMPEIDGFALAKEIQNHPDLVGSTVMMLTSADHPGAAARCKELGISAYLIKPIRQTELLDTICKILQTVPQTRVAHRNPPPHPPRLTGTRRVLLAEDNPVNRTLAIRLLEKQGYSVVAVGDGRAAVAALAEASFDLVLMDVQMPEMDGFQATAEIRRRELVSGAHIPIVAMTAHALKGDQERCLAAGMDRYIAKPIRAAELFSVIESAWFETAQTSTPPVPASAL